MRSARGQYSCSPSENQLFFYSNPGKKTVPRLARRPINLVFLGVAAKMHQRSGLLPATGEPGFILGCFKSWERLAPLTLPLFSLILSFAAMCARRKSKKVYMRTCIQGPFPVGAKKLLSSLPFFPEKNGR